MDAQLSSKAQEALGIAPGTKFWSPFPFAGMNVSASRVAIDDKQFFYLENFFKAGDGKLRTAWDVGPSIYTASGKTILSFFWFNIGLIDYVAVFFTDGTAIQIKQSDLTQTVISNTGGNFYTSGSSFPACVQSGSQYLLIANNITPNSYWIWDGSILYGAATLGPNVNITSGGSGYASVPTVTIFGGSGTGATATAVVADGSVVSVHITNPGIGYLPGEVVQMAFSGGGSDNSAILTAVLTTGTIGHIDLLDGGSGFTAGTYALTFTGGGGTGAAGTYTVDSTHSVVSLSLTNPGSGYTGTPVLTFTSGGGSGATAQAILNPGSVASVTVVDGGTGFTGTPTLTFVGGGGTGAAATANLTTGVITSVTVTNGGSGYTSVPAVEVQSGLNNGASALAELMPFGVSGTSIETFQSRVWLPFPNHQGPQQNGGTFLVSAPGSVTDFAPSDGGLVFTSSDRFLRKEYINIRQSNGYLYPFGDCSVSVISNVQTSGNPSVTTFNYQNVDPQVGASWRDSCQDFSTTILFANQLGVFGVYGGRAVKVSKDLDDIFLNAIFPPTAGALIPSSATASVFNVKHYLLLMTISDPFTEAPRNVMIAWNEKEWYVATQTADLTYIGTQEVSSNLMAWGTDGKDLFQLFEQPSSSLTKVFSTKLYGADSEFLFKDLTYVYLQAQDQSSAQGGIEGFVTVDTAGMVQDQGTVPANPDYQSVPSSTISNGLIAQPTFHAPKPYWPVWATRTLGIPGLNLGVTYASTSPDFILANVLLSYIPTAAYQ